MVCSYTDHTLQISNLDVSQIDKKKKFMHCITKHRNLTRAKILFSIFFQVLHSSRCVTTMLQLTVMELQFSM